MYRADKAQDSLMLVPERQESNYDGVKATCHPMTFGSPRRTAVFGLLLLGTVAISACRETIQADPPLRTVERSGRDLTIRLPEGVPLQAVVNLTMFDKFQPGMTEGDAEESFGSADSTGGADHVSFVEYRRPLGRVRVYTETLLSEDGMEMSNWLIGYPDDAPVERHLIPQVTRHLQVADGKVAKVYLVEGEARAFVTLTLHGGRVDEIYWSVR